MKPEHRLQAWGDRFIDRVVLPPMFTTAIDHEARDVRYAAGLKARGLKFGMPDALVMQLRLHRIICWIEYKRGANKPDARQVGIHKDLQSVGTPVYVAYNISDVLSALSLARFDLHANAENICHEYEERLAASYAKEITHSKTTKIQRRKPSRSQVARVFGAMKPL